MELDDRYSQTTYHFKLFWDTLIDGNGLKEVILGWLVGAGNNWYQVIMNTPSLASAGKFPHDSGLDFVSGVLQFDRGAGDIPNLPLHLRLRLLRNGLSRRFHSPPFAVMP